MNSGANGPFPRVCREMVVCQNARETVGLMKQRSSCLYLRSLTSPAWRLPLSRFPSIAVAAVRSDLARRRVLRYPCAHYMTGLGVRHARLAIWIGE